MGSASEPIAGESAARPKVAFFGTRFRKLNIALTILAPGLWVLALLSAWLWRTGRHRSAYISGTVFLLFLVLVVVAFAQGDKTTPTSTSNQSASSPSPPSASTKIGPAARAADDTRAKMAVERALKDIASNYQDFGDYNLVTTYTLGNVDHPLRTVHGLTARGQGKTFSLSVRSASGTTFTVHGDLLQLHRTCTPPGPGCNGGRWAGATRLALPKVPVVTAAEKAKVNAILTASVDHYEHLLKLGESVLGSTPYANATTGLSAFNDPTSAASRFRDYRKQSNPEGDLSFLSAFKKADNFYTAANEPTAISTWRDDMDSASADLSEWVNIAVGWQIREHSSAQLQAAALKVETALAKARRDVASVVASG